MSNVVTADHEVDFRAVGSFLHCGTVASSDGRSGIHKLILALKTSVLCISYIKLDNCYSS